MVDYRVMDFIGYFKCYPQGGDINCHVGYLPYGWNHWIIWGYFLAYLLLLYRV